eukprot:s1222_g1.t2
MEAEVLPDEPMPIPEDSMEAGVSLHPQEEASNRNAQRASELLARGAPDRELQEAGFPVVLDSAAKIFVKPLHYLAVVEAISTTRLYSSHVIVEEELESLVRTAISSIRSNDRVVTCGRVPLQAGQPRTWDEISEQMSFRIERTFITVHGTVRDASKHEAVAHLHALEGAADRLRLFPADLMTPGSFDEAVKGCKAVFHVASPLPVGKGAEDPENIVVRPAVEGMLNVMRACKKVPELEVVVMTSSMSAMAPTPEPEVKSEDHWSDPDGQRARGSHYGAGKTLAEKGAYNFLREEGCRCRFVSICPTMTIGPMLQPTPNMTMLSLRNWFQNGRPNGVCPNDSMSFVDVRDCAEQHIKAMEDPAAEGRYMSLVPSWHWNDLDHTMHEMYPLMPKSAPCEGTPCTPTKFDLRRQQSLGVTPRELPEILRGGLHELISKGLLPPAS